MVKLGPIEIRLADRPPVPGQEIGSTGTLVSPSAGGTGSQILTEDDYNQDLTGTKLYDEIDRMRRSDSQIKAALSVIKLPLLSSDWHVEAQGEEEIDLRIAQWIENHLIDGLIHSWDFNLRHMLLHLDMGVMPFELVWEVLDDPDFHRPLMTLIDLAPRMPRTITEWQLDNTGRLSGIKQALVDRDVEIPAEKLLMLVNEQEGSNYRGTSILRAARKDWVLKERAQKTNAIALEKRAAGVDVGTLKDGAAHNSATKKNAAEAALMGVRVHERAYLLETDDFTYRVQGIDGSILDPLPTIQYHDLMILRGVLAEFLAMGGDGSGSLAMHRDKSSFFLMALGGMAKSITGPINRELIPRIVEANFPEAQSMPQLVHSRLDRRDVGALAEALAKLIPVGAISSDPGVEAEVRELLELPEAKETEEQLRLTRRERMSTKTREMAPRTDAEKIPDFVAMVGGLDRTENNIVRGYKPIQDRQIDKLIDEAMKAIEAGDPARLERINVPFKDDASNAFSKPLEGLYRQGQTEVRKEFAKMAGGTRVRAADPLDPTDDDAVKMWLRARSRAIASSLAERLRGAMLRHSLDMIKRGQTDRNILVGKLTVLSDRDIKREAAQSVSEALNLGRDSAATENKELIQAVEYSAIMDDGTCGPCGSLDGTTFEFGSQQMQTAQPPYRNCSGFGNPRCRCVLIFTLEGESAPRG
jgi:hypothetical protein